MAQIWLLTSLTVERAWVVWCISHVKQHRVSHLIILDLINAFQLNKSSMKLVVITVWVTASLVGALPLFGWNRYVYEV